MRKWLFLLAILMTVWPAAASAQGPDERDDDSVVIRIHSDGVVAAGESVDTLAVVNSDAVIDGTVEGSLFVLHGDATIRGTVVDSVVVVSGDVHLEDGARVRNVHSVRGDVFRDPGATVSGKVYERDYRAGWAALGVFSVVLWIGVTIAAIVAGIVFALIGGRQLTSAAINMTGDVVNSIVGAVLLWVGLPILAVIAFVTVVGLPLGLGILLFVLPAAGFLGYLVAATRIGTLITNKLDRGNGDHPVLAVLLGVLILQVLLIIPFAGWLVVLLASLWGAGALAFTAYRGAGGHGFGEKTPPEAAAT
jgi:hypothetical protein